MPALTSLVRAQIASAATAVAVLVASTGLLLLVLVTASRELGYGSLTFACVLSLSLCGWVAVVGRCVDLRLPAWFYGLRPWEARLGRMLGVAAFRRAVLSRFYQGLFPSFTWGTAGRSLERLDGFLREAETLHAIVFLIVMPFALDAARQGRLEAALWFGAVNLLHNGYPVLLQRRNRARVERLRALAVTGRSSPGCGQMVA